MEAIPILSVCPAIVSIVEGRDVIIALLVIPPPLELLTVVISDEGDATADDVDVRISFSWRCWCRRCWCDCDTTARAGDDSDGRAAWQHFCSNDAANKIVPAWIRIVVSL